MQESAALGDVQHKALKLECTYNLLWAWHLRAWCIGSSSESKPTRRRSQGVLTALQMSIAEEISEFQSVAMAIMLRRKTQDDTPE